MLELMIRSVFSSCFSVSFFCWGCLTVLVFCLYRLDLEEVIPNSSHFELVLGENLGHQFGTP